jgi:hypothetical protein
LDSNVQSGDADGLDAGLAPGALLARAPGAHRRLLAGLLDQAEAHSFATTIASREAVAFAHQHFVHYAMRVMNDLIDTAVGADLSRRMLFVASGAFHKNSRLKNLPAKRWARANGGSAKLDENA